MKGKLKFLVVFILYLFIPNPIYSSESGWEIQNSNTTNVLHSVNFIDNNTGWTCGINGIILKTTNSGINWISQISHTDVYLVAIYFLNANVGFTSGFKSENYPTIGYRCIILKTLDGGINWDTIDTSTDYYITNIDFINSTTGYFSGGLYGNGTNKILKTTNSGITLEEQNSNSIGNLFSIGFANSSTGYSCGMWGNIVKTTNGGSNWFVQSVLPKHILTSITFLDENTGYVTGGDLSWEGQIVPSSYIGKTTNGGINWISQIDITNRHILYSIHFVNQFTGYACGSPDFTTISGCWHNSLYKTTNSGNEWIELTTPVIQSLTSIYFIDAYTGFAVGCDGKILKTITGGVGITNLSNEIPSGYNLFQNYPNPFNPVTKIKFDIQSMVNGELSIVNLKVYNALGKEVQTLVDQKLSPGSYEVDFDGSNFSSGIYFYSLQTEDFSQSRKMFLLK